MRKARWDAKKAQRGEEDRVMHSLFRMFGHSMHEKVDKLTAPTIVLGDAGFSNVGSKHSSFEKRFVLVANSLNYRVRCISEFYTSQISPCCLVNVREFGMRVRQCSLCSKIFHRDVMAAESLAELGEERSVHGTRNRAYSKEADQ